MSGATRGNSGLAYPTSGSFECALRTRYVQLLSGFVGASGGFAGLVLPVDMSCNRDSESDRVFPLEGISFIDRESLGWAKLGHPYRDLNFRKSCLRLWADGNLLMSGCRKPEVDLN